MHDHLGRLEEGVEPLALGGIVNELIGLKGVGAKDEDHQ